MSRAVAAWLIGLGIFAAHANWEKDFERVRVGMMSYLVFCLLLFVAMARYSEQFRWAGASGSVLVTLLVTVAAVSAYAVLHKPSHVTA